MFNETQKVNVLVYTTLCLMQVCNWWLFFRSNGQSVTHGVRAHVRLIIVYLNEKILTITFALVVGQVVLW